MGEKMKYLNPDLPMKERVQDLVSRMTLDEKVSQMSHLAPAIERLGVQAYEPDYDNPFMSAPNPFMPEPELFRTQRPWINHEHWQGGCLDGGWWNEALHGVARAGLATVFPQAIGLGSTWNPNLLQRVADAISDEARVHHQVYSKNLSYWSPTINMLRDPRWGRSEEVYSEDPYHQSRMGVAFIRGMQGENPTYLKTIATAKHFVANNSEFNRHDGSSNIPERQLHEYYFPAFKTAVEEGGVFSFMGAYNALNDKPCCANDWLLTDILRDEWGFDGFVVSDCGAISDLVHAHKMDEDPEKVVALAVRAGCDLECCTCETEQFLYSKYLPGALKEGYLTEQDIDQAVSRLFLARFKLGEFVPPERVPYSKIPVKKLDCPEHRELALEAARESIVLLKNDADMLPLDASSVNKIAVIGPFADVLELGGYSGEPPYAITVLSGIREKIGASRILFEKGCGPTQEIPGGFEKAVAAATQSDITVVVLGTNLEMANETVDRSDLNLPSIQTDLLKQVFEANPNTILILLSGLPLAVNWANEYIPAILEAWYPGQSGGQAVADILLGDINPGGKLPVTFYQSAEQLPPLDDYDVEKGRTYWYFEGEVPYPFGHGLSYTRFDYSNLYAAEDIDLSRNKSLSLQFDLGNIGERDGDEVVQLYIKDVESKYLQPKMKLRRFKRIHLKSDQSETIRFHFQKEDFSFWNPDSKKWIVETGEFEILIGSSSTDIRLVHRIYVK
jgi:beta-glucosidase